MGGAGRTEGGWGGRGRGRDKTYKMRESAGEAGEGGRGRGTHRNRDRRRVGRGACVPPAQQRRRAPAGASQLVPAPHRPGGSLGGWARMQVGSRRLAWPAGMGRFAGRALARAPSPPLTLPGAATRRAPKPGAAEFIRRLSARHWRASRSRHSSRAAAGRRRPGGPAVRSPRGVWTHEFGVTAHAAASTSSRLGPQGRWR